MAKKILLSISLLISNRPDTVRKCLDSIQPLLQAVPSELILTDTGCGEEVRGIIEEYTDHIIDFEWCKDFSKARNVGLKQAKGEWFLYLDDDEWFDDTTEIIQFFRSGEYKKYGYALYTQRNYIIQGTDIYTDLPVGRMIRLEPDIAFMYSIHECFNRVPGKVKKFNSFVYHYGYAYASEAEALKHAMRNIELLDVECRENPGNMKHRAQLVQEYNSIKNYEKSLSLSLEAITYAKNNPIEMEFCLGSMYDNTIDCYMRLEREDEAISVGEKYLAEEELDPLAKAVIVGILAEAYLDKGEMEKCIEKAILFEKTYREYRKNEAPFLAALTTINSSCFEMRNCSMVFGCGVQALVCGGRALEALKLFHSIDLDSEKAFVNNEMILAIVRRMVRIGGENAKEPVGEKVRRELGALEEMCNKLLRRKDMEYCMAEDVLNCVQKANELTVFAGLQSEHWVFALARLLKGEECEKNALAVWKQAEESLPFIKKYDAMGALVSSGGDAGKLFSQIPFYIWEGCLGKTDDIEWLRKWCALLPDSEKLKKFAWENRILYGEIVKASKDVQGSEEVEDTIWRYGNVTVALCEQIYRTEILEGNRDVLPAKYQAALSIKDLKEALDSNRLGEALDSIKRVKELAPQFTGALKPILAKLQQKTQNAASEHKAMTDEMQILGMQIKLKIRQLMQNGKNQEALSAAKQLSGLLPGDTDLQAMIGKLEKQCEGNN